MNLNRIRPYTSILLLLLFCVLLFTGVLLYYSPSGHGAGRELIFGYSKHEIKSLHFYFALIAIGLVLFHAYLNIKALAKYLGRQKRGKNWLHPLLWASLTVVVSGSVILSSN